MADKKFILIRKDRIYFSWKESIDAKPVFPSVKFNERNAIYWQVEGTFEDGIATLKVVDYNPSDTTAFHNQELSAEIFQVSFIKLKWEELEKVIWSYSASYKKYIQVAYGRDELHTKEAQNEQTEHAIGPDYYVPNFIRLTERVPFDIRTDTVRTEEFEYSYKQAKFCDGFVQVEKRFDWQKNKQTLLIRNSSILPEFDSIKYYFGKAINGQKKFKVKATFTIRHGGIMGYEAESDEISKIDSALIDKVRKVRIYSFTSIPRIRKKSLLSAEELQQSSKQEASNIFKETAIDIIKALVTKEGIRNAKQLQYLSGHKQVAHEKIQFSLRPLFGFLFSIEGKEKHHYCWELLNSHATYIWSFDKGALHTERIEATISLIHEIGRDAYKILYKNGEVDQDSLFSTIHHAKEHGRTAEVFLRWQKILNDSLQ